MLLEMLTVLPVLGFLGFNFSKQDSQAKQETGLRGTQYFDEAAAGAAGGLRDLRGLTDELVQSPYGSFRGQTGAQMFDPGQFGLGTAADQGVQQALNYSLNRMSASGAARGQLAPENAPAVAASATQNVLPQLLPQITQMAQWIYQLPEQWKQSLFGYRSQLASSYAPYLGAQGSSSSSGFGFGAQVGGDKLFPTSIN